MSRLQSVVGVHVFNAQFREDFQTYFYRPHADFPCLNSLMFVVKGKAHLEFREARLAAGPGSLLCWASRDLVLARSDPRRPVSYFMLNFDLIDTRGKILPAAEAGIQFHQKILHSGKMTAQLRELCREWRLKGKYRLMNCSKKTLELIQTLEEGAHPIRKPVTERYTDMDRRIAGVLDLLRVNFKKNFTLSQLAEKACLHPKYFARLFKQMAGISPHQFQLRRKIEMAKDWLLLHEEPFLYTGEDLGFSDYSHFFRVFRKMTGLTPRDYCRKFRAESLPPGRPRRGRTS